MTHKAPVKKKNLTWSAPAQYTDDEAISYFNGIGKWGVSFADLFKKSKVTASPVKPEATVEKVTVLEPTVPVVSVLELTVPVVSVIKTTVETASVVEPAVKITTVVEPTVKGIEVGESTVNVVEPTVEVISALVPSVKIFTVVEPAEVFVAVEPAIEVVASVEPTVEVVKVVEAAVPVVAAVEQVLDITTFVEPFIEVVTAIEPVVRVAEPVVESVTLADSDVQAIGSEDVSLPLTIPKVPIEKPMAPEFVGDLAVIVSAAEKVIMAIECLGEAPVSKMASFEVVEPTLVEECDVVDQDLPSADLDLEGIIGAQIELALSKEATEIKEVAISIPNEDSEQGLICKTSTEVEMLGTLGSQVAKNDSANVIVIQEGDTTVQFTENATLAEVSVKNENAESALEAHDEMLATELAKFLSFGFKGNLDY
jgi:hypothetical protein